MKKGTPRFIDLTGQRFGLLTVIKRAGYIGHAASWQCVCDCGGEKISGTAHLRQGLLSSCGCKTEAPNLLGQKFGNLTVVARGENDGTAARWVCICDCGRTQLIRGSHLRRGITKTCGCSRILDRTYPEPPPVSGARWIPLGHGKFTLVDEEDFERLNVYLWHADSNGYVRREFKGGFSFMHIEILGIKGVDHRDGNPANNRKSNLRPATHADQMRNRRKMKHSKWPFKGIKMMPDGRWYAQIRLGTFNTAEEAARAYDDAATQIFGEFARINFPEPEPSLEPPPGVAPGPAR